MAIYPYDHGPIIDDDALLECEDCRNEYRTSIVVDPRRNFFTHSENCPKCKSENAKIKESPLQDRSFLADLLGE